jgi:hypothetical protein
MYQPHTTATLVYPATELCVSYTQSKNGVTIFTFAGASSEAVKWSSSRNRGTQPAKEVFVPCSCSYLFLSRNIESCGF